MASTAATPTPAAPRIAIDRATWLGFVAIVVASVMDLLDSTITQTAGPAIRRDLGGTLTDLEWFTAAYTLAMSAALLIASRLGDRFGRRKVLLIGMACFILASTVCAVASSAPFLITARVVQGMTAALMLPQGYGLIRQMFGDDGQQRAFAVFGPMMGMTAVLGPLIGGGLVNLDVAGLTWRAVFLVNVPVGLGALALGWRYVVADRPSHPDVRFDPVSVLLSAAIGFGLVFPLIEGRSYGWPWWTFALLAGSVLAAVLFVRHQRGLVRAGQPPLVEPSILGRRQYIAGLATVLAFFGAMGGMFITLNVMYQVGLGLSPLGSGLATVAIPVMAVPGSIISSILLPKIGRTTMHIGLAMMAAGLVAVYVVMNAEGASLTAWELVGPLALTGLGMGQVFVPMFDVILAGVEPQQIGSASGLLQATQQLAMSIGIAVIGTVMFDNLDAAFSRAGVFVHGASVGTIVDIIFLAVAGAVVCFLPQFARPVAGAH
jgi:EmrB/QacA subfamily drug resistance transporter